jgi:pyruvate kinase
MLSAETSTGKHPVEAVAFMNRIAIETEHAIRAHGYQEPQRVPRASTAEIVADAAYHAAREAKVAAIVVFTASGSSPRLISRYRPPVPIYAITSTEAVARRLSINFGVTSILAPETGSTEEMMNLLDKLLVPAFLKKGDTVVFVAGQPIGIAGTTNLMKIHRIG